MRFTEPFIPEELFFEIAFLIGTEVGHVLWLLAYLTSHGSPISPGRIVAGNSDPSELTSISFPEAKTMYLPWMEVARGPSVESE